MSNFEDPNFGMVGGNKDSFEQWAENTVDLNSFDLIDFIGADEESNNDNVQFGLTEEERNFNQKDKAYTTLQYNQNMFNDFTNDSMRNGQFEGFENQYPGVSNFVGTSNDGRGILSNNSGYGNVVDSSMIPTTSKSSIPMPIKIEPGYEDVDVGKMNFDDSGTYSDADSYAHSIGSAGVYDQNGVYQPKTKPRKYRVKPQEEKVNPVYKVKREKNNDAVRRSRDKAKRIQIEKDERLAFLEQENVKDKRAIQQLKSQLSTMIRNCSCGAAAGASGRM